MGNWIGICSRIGFRGNNLSIRLPMRVSTSHKTISPAAGRTAPRQGSIACERETMKFIIRMACKSPVQSDMDHKEPAKDHGENQCLTSRRADASRATQKPNRRANGPIEKRRDRYRRATGSIREARAIHTETSRPAHAPARSAIVR